MMKWSLTMDLSTIDPTVGAAIINLGTALSSLVLKGTGTAIHGKIASLKNETNTDTIRNAYNEMVNQLLEEREEALLIAQSYKAELEKVVISDEDIEYLQNTISKVLDLLVGAQFIDINNEDPAIQAKAKSQKDTVESIKGLISKDVLKTMQLIGFNYKAAIGEPLTVLCAEKIKALSNNNSQDYGKTSGNIQQKKPYKR